MMNNNDKIWHVQNKSLRFSDQELIDWIKRGDITADDYISNRDLKTWIKVKDSIYQFYLPTNTLN